MKRFLARRLEGKRGIARVVGPAITHGQPEFGKPVSGYHCHGADSLERRPQDSIIRPFLEDLILGTGTVPDALLCDCPPARLEAHRSRAVLAHALGSSNLTIFVPGRDMHPEQACDVREGR